MSMKNTNIQIKLHYGKTVCDKMSMVDLEMRDIFCKINLRARQHGNCVLPCNKVKWTRQTACVHQILMY